MSFIFPFDLANQASDYWMDSIQRQILFLDTMQKRSQNSCKTDEDNLLKFETELIIDGRDSSPAVNYKLEKIINKNEDLSKRPIIIFEPRAAQASGIAGIKEDGQIGQAVKNGNPTYYVSFFAKPEKDQTIESVCNACTDFVKKVKSIHNKSKKPLLIGNCQAGWQIAMMHAANPDLDCLLLLSGAPISYWSGSHGSNPIRYISGITGGTWAVDFASDIGNGYFDSAHLIDNFEKNCPSVSYWKKQYDLYSNIDTDEQKFLDFEKWWNSTIFFNKEEIKFIVEKLFIGNQLSKGEIKFENGNIARLQNIKTPIFVLCSTNDVITPAPQALGWILDCYKSDEEIINEKQTIIYYVDNQAGHLGLIASSTIMENIYKKIFICDDEIEKLDNGIYEAIENGDHFIFERRSINDIDKICHTEETDKELFDNVEITSDILQKLYDGFLSPMIQSYTNDQTAEAIRELHIVRSRLTSSCIENPALSNLALHIKNNRLQTSKDNIFYEIQEEFSNQTINQINMVNKQKDDLIDNIFSTIYNAPWLKYIKI